MKNLTSQQIRQMFLDYFKEQGCSIEPSASLIPHNDPTLLWINAGVAALKKYFDGSVKPENPRIANAQKCIRTNDIENVGKTARHHTFFEMLGNFSIGDYFKKEAIPFAWNFLTDPKWIGLEKEKMYVTMHPTDEEAYQIWTTLTDLDPKHILKSEDNYWEIGEGPCGPDTEIYYDRGEKYDPLGLGEELFFKEMENDRYIEVWNVVFSQYDAKEGVQRENYKELPQKNIDTGMGLERLVCIVQQGETNYDTDLFLPVIKATEKLALHPYEGEYKMAYRVIADHIRTVTFALADGALFSNEGRGYVLRRVLRRAVRYGIKLGIKGSFMYNLVEIVAKNMESYYPYLTSKVDLISKLVKAEEERFHLTLDSGEKLLKEEIANSNNKKLTGEVVFKLYDTFGFPFELTKEICEELGYQVDEEGFKVKMEEQRERAREARSDEQSFGSQAKDLMDFTADSEFVGYSQNICDGKVIALFKDGVKVNEITDEGDIIVDKTCFYAESGGQVADSGFIFNEDMKAEVKDVKKAPHKQHLHHVVVEKGKIKLNDKVKLEIDLNKRNLTRANHSSAHLLQSALRTVIGDHVHQAGSYVSSEIMRFDFTHFEKISDEDLMTIEKMVNKWIAEKNKVETEIMNIDDAKKTGATALFDEKYGDKVRVVSMGDVSKEFCGGTHVSNTSEIGCFKIVSEESIGSGVRRITALTSLNAYNEYLNEEHILDTLVNKLKSGSKNLLISKLEQLIDEHKNLETLCADQNTKLMTLEANNLKDSYQEVNGLNILVKEFKNASTDSLKNIIDSLKVSVSNDVTFLYTLNEDKVVFVAHVSESGIKKNIKAGDLVKKAAVICNGNGGGRPDMAQAGGKDLTKVNQAITEIKKTLGL